MYSFKKPAKAFLCITQISGPAMELGWLLGHLVYVRGLLPELFGALAEPRRDFCLLLSQWTRCRQSCLLSCWSEEMENGSTRQQLM